MGVCIIARFRGAAGRGECGCAPPPAVHTCLRTCLYIEAHIILYILIAFQIIFLENKYFLLFISEGYLSSMLEKERSGQQPWVDTQTYHKYVIRVNYLKY